MVSREWGYFGWNSRFCQLCVDGAAFFMVIFEAIRQFEFQEGKGVCDRIADFLGCYKDKPYTYR